jgi:hypothetical protein
MPMVSAANESTPPCCSGKRNEGIPAIINTMTKDSRNMSVFLLTAAKVVLLIEN